MLPSLHLLAIKPIGTSAKEIVELLSNKVGEQVFLPDDTSSDDAIVKALERLSDLDIAEDDLPTCLICNVALTDMDEHTESTTIDTRDGPKTRTLKQGGLPIIVCGSAAGGHVFHRQCIINAMNLSVKKDNCPVCSLPLLPRVKTLIENGNKRTRDDRENSAHWVLRPGEIMYVAQLAGSGRGEYAALDTAQPFHFDFWAAPVELHLVITNLVFIRFMEEKMFKRYNSWTTLSIRIYRKQQPQAFLDQYGFRAVAAVISALFNEDDWREVHHTFMEYWRSTEDLVVAGSELPMSFFDRSLGRDFWSYFVFPNRILLEMSRIPRGHEHNLADRLDRLAEDYEMERFRSRYYNLVSLEWGASNQEILPKLEWLTDFRMLSSSEIEAAKKIIPSTGRASGTFLIDFQLAEECRMAISYLMLLRFMSQKYYLAYKPYNPIHAQTQHNDLTFEQILFWCQVSFSASDWEKAFQPWTGGDMFPMFVCADKTYWGLDNNSHFVITLNHIEAEQADIAEWWAVAHEKLDEMLARIQRLE